MGHLEHGRSYLRHADEEAFEKAVRAAAAGLEATAATAPPAT